MGYEANKCVRGSLALRLVYSSIQRPRLGSCVEFAQAYTSSLVVSFATPKRLLSKRMSKSERSPSGGNTSRTMELCVLPE